MPTSTKQQRVKELLDQIKKQDPGLAEELNDKQSGKKLKEEAERVKAEMADGNETSFESMGDDTGDTMELEAVVLRVGRPVLLINNNEAELSFDDAESEVWRGRLTGAKQQLALSIPSVGRIELANHPSLDWCGTGWLVDKNTVVTNRHVAELFGRNKGAGFVFRQGDDGKPIRCSIDLLEEAGSSNERVLKLSQILHIEPEPGPDFAFIKAEPVNDKPPKPVALDIKPVADLRSVAVIGYPAKDSRMPDVELMEKIFGNVFGKKRLAPGNITSSTEAKLFHDCSTLGGCSGSAIIDLKTGKAVGLHFAGRFLQSNYAVPAALVAKKLDEIKNKKTIVAVNEASSSTDTTTIAAVSPLPATVQAGNFSFTIPLQVTVSLGQPADSSAQAVTVSNGVAPKPAEEADEFIAEGKVEDYTDRKGYDADFLGEDFKVPLPKVVGEKRKKDVLTYKLNGKEEQVLRYQHYSVVMSKNRRQCIFSAVNINGSKSKKAARTPWRFDPRIPREAQIMNECYGSAPKYSRGHMTRREDPVWGTEAEALQGNSDSMCVTNTTPQMQSFNAPVWLALEDYALQHAREDRMSISVFTGPVFKSNDPVQYGVKIPVWFWKVIAFIHDETGKLTATGYMMSQEEHIPDVEFIFGAFSTAQVSIASIEKQTGLSFGKLTEFDPMNDEAAGDLVKPIEDKGQIRF